MHLPFCVPAQVFLLFLLSTGKHTRRPPGMADYGFLGRKISTLANIDTLNFMIVYAHGPRINNEAGMTIHACFYF